MAPFRLATRGSPLALRQTEIVARLLRDRHADLDVEVVVVRTRGDDLSASLDQIGGQGVFVTEVEAAVASGRADAAVHSAKDLTSTMTPDLVLAAVPVRADARDGLVGCALADLPAGGLIATGSAPPARPVGLRAPRSELHRDPGQHGTARLPGRRRLGQPRWWLRWRRWSGWAGCIASATSSTRSTCCPRRDRERSPCSAAPTTTSPAACSPPLTMRPHTVPWRPRGPSWPAWGKLHGARRRMGADHGGLFGVARARARGQRGRAGGGQDVPPR